MLTLQAVFWLLAGVLIFGGAWLFLRALVLDRSRGRRRCPGCWYELGPGVSRRCPECGSEAGSERALLRTRRRWGAGAMALLLVGVGGASLRAPEAWDRGSWWALAPVWVLGPVLELDSRLRPEPEPQAQASGVLRVRARPGPTPTSALERYREAWRSVKRLTGARGENTAGEHLFAILQLQSLGYEARVALPALRRIAGAEDEAAGLAIIRLLGDMQDVRETERILARLARSPNPHVQLAAIQGLAKRQARPQLVLPILAQRLRDDPLMMTTYVHLLGRYEQRSVPIMADLLETQRSDVKAILLFYLLNAGPHSPARHERVKQEIAAADGLLLKNVLWRMGWEGGHPEYVERTLREVWDRLDPAAQLVIAGWVVNQRKAWAAGQSFVVMGMRSPDAGLRRAIAEMYRSQEVGMSLTIRAELERLATEDPDARVGAMARAALEREKAGGQPIQGPELPMWR